MRKLLSLNVHIIRKAKKCAQFVGVLVRARSTQNFIQKGFEEHYMTMLLLLIFKSKISVYNRKKI